MLSYLRTEREERGGVQWGRGTLFSRSRGKKSMCCRQRRRGGEFFPNEKRGSNSWHCPPGEEEGGADFLRGASDKEALTHETPEGSPPSKI